jgi:hypothetical protein
MILLPLMFVSYYVTLLRLNPNVKSNALVTFIHLPFQLIDTISLLELASFNGIYVKAQ